MEPIRLIHPIYLDVPMMVSFAAALEGGLSFGSEVTSGKGSSQSESTKFTAKLALSEVLSSIIGVSLTGSVSDTSTAQDSEVRRESKAHTEASIAIVLYDKLRRISGYLAHPQSAADFDALEPGALVEISGIMEKNAIDAVIDYIDAINILGNAGGSQLAPKDKKQNVKSLHPLNVMRDAFDKDRRRTPISNMLLRCAQPEGMTVVVTLRTQNLRDLTMSELHKNTVRVVGKVTRIIGDGETMSAFENYGLAMLPPETLEVAFKALSSAETLDVQFSEVQVKGPSVQILPLIVFV